jgi:hypothetical protein
MRRHIDFARLPEACHQRDFGVLNFVVGRMRPIAIVFDQHVDRRHHRYMGKCKVSVAFLPLARGSERHRTHCTSCSRCTPHKRSGRSRVLAILRNDFERQLELHELIFRLIIEQPGIESTSTQFEHEQEAPRHQAFRRFLGKLGPIQDAVDVWERRCVAHQNPTGLWLAKLMRQIRSYPLVAPAAKTPQVLSVGVGQHGGTIDASWLPYLLTVAFFSPYWRSPPEWPCRQAQPQHSVRRSPPLNAFPSAETIHITN